MAVKTGKTAGEGFSEFQKKLLSEIDTISKEDFTESKFNGSKVFEILKGFSKKFGKFIVVFVKIDTGEKMKVFLPPRNFNLLDDFENGDKISENLKLYAEKLHANTGNNYYNFWFED